MNLLLKLTSFAVAALSSTQAHELVAPAAVSTDASANSDDGAEPRGNLHAAKLEGVLEALDYMTEEVEDLYEEQLDEPDGAFLEAISSRCTDYRRRRSQQEGRRAVRKVFDDMGGDCANAIGGGQNSFRREVNRMADRDYPDNSRVNWRTRRINRCARQGIDEEVQAVEKECLHDDTEICEDLAIYAAEQIVDRHEECSASDFGTAGHKDESKRNFRRECRQLAQDLCRGETRTQYRALCGKSPDGTLSRKMMDECDAEVIDILRNGEETDSGSGSSDEEPDQFKQCKKACKAANCKGSISSGDELEACKDACREGCGSNDNYSDFSSSFTFDSGDVFASEDGDGAAGLQALTSGRNLRQRQT